MAESNRVDIVLVHGSVYVYFYLSEKTIESRLNYSSSSKLSFRPDVFIVISFTTSFIDSSEVNKKK